MNEEKEETAIYEVELRGKINLRLPADYFQTGDLLDLLKDEIIDLMKKENAFRMLNHEVYEELEDAPRKVKVFEWTENQEFITL